MARITGAQNERVFQIKQWLGLNQNPDGDTKLKMGEAAVMRNWKVTRDHNLQKRPGTKAVQTVSNTAGDHIEAVWTGIVAGNEYALCIIVHDTTPATGTLYKLAKGDDWTLGGSIGSIGTVSGAPHMFGFDGKLWILTGADFYCWDGTNLTKPDGYRPLVAVAIPPDGGGELLEQVNKLNGLRRCWISPDGTGKDFPLPLGGTIDSTKVKVYDNATELEVTTGWSYSDGVVSFTTAPAEGTNSYEIQWEVSQNYRSSVCAMHYSEIFNGSQDSRVFLYGDGSAQAFYSGLDDKGKARADYWPDLNQIQVGVANTPITGMIRQLSRLVCFKTDSTWVIQFGTVTTAEGSLIPGFYVTPVNRTLGNVAPGQVQLVLNEPVTLFGQDIYKWQSNSYGNLTADERQAKRISDRVFQAARQLELGYCHTLDDNYNQEYYIYDGEGNALVWNYAADAWYIYQDFMMYYPFSYQGQLYNAVGAVIQHISNDYFYDQAEENGDLQEIDCYWESGSMSFGMDYQRKYSAMIWLGIKPESRAAVRVTVITDKSSKYQEKVVSKFLANFDHVNFGNWTFFTSRKPQMKRLKIKAKKFVFYKLVLESPKVEEDESTQYTTATVVSADIRVRFTGYAK